MKVSNIFEKVIGLDNLLLAWREFLNGKRKKRDVQDFASDLFTNIISLHKDLIYKTYRHGSYHSFYVSDPKLRHIYKACVRDRLLHHAVHRVLYPLFDKTFIADSFSCRKNKGTHKAIDRFRSFACKVSKNNTQTCWVLKCDIRKFFANIDHAILLNILQKTIDDQDFMWLLCEIIMSFHAGRPSVGLPIGNLTSQLMVNVYMNEFDQFVKHILRESCYIRYADDFVFLSDDKAHLQKLIKDVKDFLYDVLKLEIHSGKISITSLASGVDFLGWITFVDHRIPRTTTKQRVKRRIAEHPNPETLQSYLGLLQHGNTHKLRSEIFKIYFLST